ncbi:uncharacterized protein LOC131874969 [Cryptomeria japonica]|uniref:uncharacterized protein LOC131874969 n=1 Tax=Cryptomeria japonica TaxID=3369 RepID=UPI0027D9E3FA|nr:uncharacterized protein LOC131874969 [Cryptomeria japonica]
METQTDPPAKDESNTLTDGLQIVKSVGQTFGTSMSEFRPTNPGSGAPVVAGQSCSGGSRAASVGWRFPNSWVWAAEEEFGPGGAKVASDKGGQAGRSWAGGGPQAARAIGSGGQGPLGQWAGVEWGLLKQPATVATRCDERQGKRCGGRGRQEAGGQRPGRWGSEEAEGRGAGGRQGLVGSHGGWKR